VKITQSKLIQEIKKIWPTLTKANTYIPGNIWITDSNYWLPKRSDVEEFLASDKTDLLKWKEEIHDCDDVSLYLNAAVKRSWFWLSKFKEIPEEQWISWAFGECWGTQFKGKKTHHAINICMTRDEGILLVEPQTDEVWIPNNKDDKLYFLKF